MVRPRNRAEFYRLVAALAWLPRSARLALAGRVGRLVSRPLPAEQAVIRKTLGAVTGATDWRLEELTSEVFAEFAMCFTDLVSTSRQPPGTLLAHVGARSGMEHLDRLEGAVISLTAHVGNWDLAGSLPGFLCRRHRRDAPGLIARETFCSAAIWLGGSP